MSAETRIAWTQKTWNPVVGCTKVSPGCKHCYAFDLHAKRHRAYQEGKLQSVPQYARPFDELQFLARRLDEPRHWRKPVMVFINSVSDLFHDDVTDEQIEAVLAVCRDTPRHTYQVLTKRAERLASFAYPSNLWVGVTVENQAAEAVRVPLLRRARAAVRFLSCEPLLEPLTLDLAGIAWVIVGGEKAGARARPMDPEWARAIRAQCQAARVPFFMKQMRNEAPIPTELMVRDYPRANRNGNDNLL